MNIESYITETLGIEAKRVSNDELLSLCPAPWHKDRHPSFYINRNTGLFQCKSCGFRGNLEALSKVVLGKQEGLRQFRESSGITGNEIDFLKRKIKDAKEETQSKETKSEFDQSLHDQFLKEFQECPLLNPDIGTKIKGFLTKEIIDHYGIRHWIHPGLYYNFLAIPVYDHVRELQNLNFRNLSKDTKPKYRCLPSKAAKFQSNELVFRNRLVKETNEYLFITEGIMDAIYLGEHGYPSVAVFTNLISPQQTLQITSLTNLGIIFFDGDEQGIQGSWKSYRILKEYIKCKQFWEPDKDPDEVNDFGRLNWKIEKWTR